MFTIVYRPEAVKALGKIPAAFRCRIIKAIDGLIVDPHRGKKLQGKYLGAFSLRVWPYRIIYLLDKAKIMIVISI